MATYIARSAIELYHSNEREFIDIA